MADKDVTDSVGFGSTDSDLLPLEKCVCGKVFTYWDQVLGIHRSLATQCPRCERRLYFRAIIRVYEVVSTSADEV